MNTFLAFVLGVVVGVGGTLAYQHMDTSNEGEIKFVVPRDWNFRVNHQRD